jgi:hypothetical protein
LFISWIHNSKFEKRLKRSGERQEDKPSKRLQSQMITNMVALHVTNYAGKIIDY